ncbi:protein terminal ear1 homolog [Selaginella moellendorffii]|uniref:protein terminal ear1 homolog n=1 Tax=Selaginella moellendorffii TaxID=88036 RepID=UPI000D1CC971|nr:protein terminal ear1 homolog [Selaginella moellendorffii]|eukprot:XP_024525844.1 protein terminal ear1 homolog [Selaginella moellendorffii]
MEQGYNLGFLAFWAGRMMIFAPPIVDPAPAQWIKIFPRFLPAPILSKLNPDAREFQPLEESIAPLPAFSSPLAPPHRRHEFSLVQESSDEDENRLEQQESGEESETSAQEDCDRGGEEEEEGMAQYFFYPSPIFDSISNVRHIAPSSIAREHSSRSLILGNIPYPIDPGQLQSQLEQWGALRYISFAAMAERGIVIAHYCDVRHAAQALKDIHAQHLIQQHKFLLLRRMDHFQRAWRHAAREDAKSAARRQIEVTRAALRAAGEKLRRERGLVCGAALWAKFVPLCCCVSEKEEFPEMENQGTLVVFNLDVAISIETINSVFKKYGDVKEIRETPIKRTHKFVEFFDVRDAARAKEALDGEDILGSTVKIEFSRPGGMLQRHSEHHSILDLYPAVAFESFQRAVEWKAPPPPAAAPLFTPPGFYAGVPPAISTYQAWQAPLWSFSGARGNPKERRRMLEDCSYKFDEELKDERTTLMIKNLPNKYSQEKLMDKIDGHCAQCNAHIDSSEDVSAYDFLYLPIDPRNQCNLGYAFVNFVSVAACGRFYKAFHNLQWEAHNSRKICQITYARIQGRAKLQEHVKRGDRDSLPLVFDPPRSGKI